MGWMEETRWWMPLTARKLFILGVGALLLNFLLDGATSVTHYYSSISVQQGMIPLYLRLQSFVMGLYFLSSIASSLGYWLILLAAALWTWTPVRFRQANETPPAPSVSLRPSMAKHCRLWAWGVLTLVVSVVGIILLAVGLDLASPPFQIHIHVLGGVTSTLRAVSNIGVGLLVLGTAAWIWPPAPAGKRAATPDMCNCA